MNLCISMFICIVKFIDDIGETLTGLTGLKWSCDVRQDHVLSFVIFLICGHSFICVIQGVCEPIII